MLNKSSLTTQAIHDDANSSVGGIRYEDRMIMIEDDNPEVHRQMTISERAYNDKIILMNRLVTKAGGVLSGRVFKSCKKNQTEDSNIHEYQFFTSKGASLTIALSRYQNTTHYFGTKGSPMKILTGQNVVEQAEEKRVSDLAKELDDCTLFEARSIFGFRMIEDCVRYELGGEKLFNKKELSDIDNRNISVFSVGFATYMKLGDRRDDMFHVLCCMARSEAEYAGTNIPLASYLGVTVECWPKAAKSDKQKHLFQSLLVQKKISGSLSFTQMMYLKDYEIEHKRKKSGMENNYLVEERLTEEQRMELGKVVRIDNTFFKSYIKQWLGWLSKLPGYESLKEVKHQKLLMLKDCAPLFDNPAMVLAMSKHMLQDLGIVTRLTRSPTIKRINAYMYSDHPDNPMSAEHRELCAEWHKAGSADIKNNQLNLAPDKDEETGDDNPKSFLGTSKRRRRLAEEILNLYDLDLKLPYSFYSQLNSLRFKIFLTGAQHLSADNFLTEGKVDRHFEGSIDDIRMAARKEYHSFITYCKNYIPQLTETKRELLIQHLITTE